MSLVRSYKQRQRLMEQKQSRLLGFLRSETWTIAEIVAVVLGCTRPAGHKTLNQMQARGLVQSHRVPELGLSLWGVTPMGLAYAWGEDEAMEQRPYFEPSKVALSTIHHHLDIQRARLRCEAEGWRNWIPGTQLPLKAPKRPDAIVTSPKGSKVAVEVERTIKTLRRYKSIWAGYLRLIKEGRYDAVHYICPDEVFAQRLTRVFGLITEVPFAGQKVPITDRHRSKILVFPMSTWPT